MQIPELWRTTVFRLTSVYGAVFAVGIAVLLCMIYAQTAGFMTRSVDHLIDAGLAQLVQTKAEQLPEVIKTSLDHDVRRLNYYGLYSNDGVWIVGNIHVLPAKLRIDGHPVELDVGGDAQADIRARAIRLPWGEILLVGRDIGQVTTVRTILLHAMLASGGLILLLGLGAASALSVGPLRRLQELQAASQVIMGGDLSARLPTRGRRDELDMLASIVNVMMGDIERLLTQAKGVGDGLAHDLRTPVTRLRALLYRVQEQTGVDDDHRPMIEQALAETDVLLTRFRALLRISEIEKEQRRSGFSPIDLKVVLDQAMELYGPVAENKGVVFSADLASVASIDADGELIFEAVSNLIDNAIKFTPRGRNVALSLKASPGGPQIEVTDAGPGIAETERQLVVQRFYRSSSAMGVPGSGLGLSIVAAIAALHGFKLRFEEAGPGLRVVIDCWWDRSG